MKILGAEGSDASEAPRLEKTVLCVIPLRVRLAVVPRRDLDHRERLAPGTTPISVFDARIARMQATRRFHPAVVPRRGMRT